MAEPAEIFVCEIPLRVTPSQERELLVRLECARHIYNACLGEGLRRIQLARESRAWQAARALPTRSAERTRRFKELRERFGLSLYALLSPSNELATASWPGTKQFTHTWLGEHVDSQTVQTIAARAWRALESYAYGAGGRPRFKRRGQMSSVEGKAVGNPLRWERGGVTWKGLRLMAVGDLVHPRREIAHGLAIVEAGGLRFTRLVHREIWGVHRFFAQLVVRGRPIERCVRGHGVVGIDLGPSTVAVVGDSTAFLEQLAPGVAAVSDERRLVQRRLDRSRRAMNPANFAADGTCRPGPKTWVTSRRYRRLRERLAELDRRRAAMRRCEHDRLAHRIIGMGDAIHLEKLSYVGFQKSFGRSVGDRAPGFFVATLMRKAASAGVLVVEINPWSTRLSQTCVCGAIRKKALSERVHDCPSCGAVLQRDLMSAYLARFVAADGVSLHADQARVAWPGSRSTTLQAAWRGCGTGKLAGLRAMPPAPSCDAAAELVACAASADGGEARDAVADRREPERAAATRCPPARAS